ncbi:hypothetical protein N7481_003960 [Penicillium waksmanii]|uniref:uncharacterized protein n=1 Tax=Penicillium waksmanii TaxID=69791 RepID=UPI002546CF7E|nr:uncharacterized protein N7481_003960 [Penicillium waksmanii]KAJ5988750.1 hypothetical protein N7481_003960 [Penicillium waksmanii]
MDIRKMGLPQSAGFIKSVYYELENGTFSECFDYDHGGKEYQCPSSIISDLLFAEYEFRAITQLKEGYMELKSTKNMELPSLENIDVEDVLREANLSVKVLALPSTPRQIYMTIRKDKKWYLRTTLKSQCAETGGCCGQECNYCEKRLNTLLHSDMNGHCLRACPCCMKGKRFYPKANEEAIIGKQYKDALESDHPAFLMYMADAYFSKLHERLTPNDEPPTSNPPPYSATRSQRPKWSSTSSLQRHKSNK